MVHIDLLRTHKISSYSSNLSLDGFCSSFNIALLRANFALLMLNVALLEFMVCALDFQIRIYLHTHRKSSICISVSTFKGLRTFYKRHQSSSRPTQINKRMTEA